MVTEVILYILLFVIIAAAGTFVYLHLRGLVKDNSTSIETTATALDGSVKAINNEIQSLKETDLTNKTSFSTGALSSDTLKVEGNIEAESILIKGSTGDVIKASSDGGVVASALSTDSLKIGDMTFSPESNINTVQLGEAGRICFGIDLTNNCLKLDELRAIKKNISDIEELKAHTHDPVPTETSVPPTTTTTTTATATPTTTAPATQ